MGVIGSNMIPKSGKGFVSIISLQLITTADAANNVYQTRLLKTANNMVQTSLYIFVNCQDDTH